MANVTATVSAVTTGWVKVADAAEIALLTPIAPDVSLLVRFSVADPTAAVTTGHVISRNPSTPNAVSFGSANTDAIWVRAVNKNTDVLVTKL